MAFDPDFLGLTLAAPVTPVPVVNLDYTHFSVGLDSERRLARMTAANVDGASLVDLARGDDWRLDDRIPASAQAGADIYRDNDFDRGHLVRRRDPVWGDAATARQAESDTFHYTNAAPQASQFNQSMQLWLGLEDHVIAFAEVNRLRIDVFTAPIFADTDEPYRGIRVPHRFFKIVAWATSSGLAAAGFILDQTPLLEDGRIRRRVRAEDPPPLGPFRAFQVQLGMIRTATGLVMDELVAADRMPLGVLPVAPIELHSAADIVL